MAPSAQALDIGRTISGAALTASAAGRQVKPVTEGVVGRNLDKRVNAAKKAVKAGSDAVEAGRELTS
ncbi:MULTISPECIES: hypothetical protein [unclassified Streptomyces]